MAGGRPSKYDPKYNLQVFKLALLGATEKQLADFFEVSVDTITEWKNKFPEFSASLKRGKEEADTRVANSLFKRATGFKHKDVKIFQYEGQPVIVPYTAYYPPDTTAQIFWLKNRQSKQWRDKQEIEHSLQEEQVFKIAGQTIKF